MGMTNVGAPLRIGGASSAAVDGGQPGAPNSPIYAYQVTPATLQADNVAVLQTVSGAIFTLAAGTSVTSTTVNGTTYYALDVARNLRATGGSVSTAATLITVAGLDTYRQPMTETFTGPTGTAVTSTVKAFQYVRSITAAGNTTSTVSIGTGDVFGFPYRVATYGDTRIWWDIAGITNSVGITLAVTSAATATTGDVRGTYASATASNGARILSVWIAVQNPDSLTNIYGVTQA